MSEESFEEPLPPAEAPAGFDQFVRNNPVTAVIGALVIGLLLGRTGIL